MSTFAIIVICILVIVNFFLAIVAGWATGQLRMLKDESEEEEACPVDALIPAIAAAIVMNEKRKEKKDEDPENPETTQDPEPGKEEGADK